MTVRRHLARKMILPSGARTWTVCDPHGIPMLDVDDYLQALRARPASVNTLKSYSEHLAALLTYLDVEVGTSWEAVGFSDLTEFMIAYRNGVPPVTKRGTGSRGVATMRSAAAAIRGFCDYHRHDTGRGPTDLRLSKEVTRNGKGNPHHFLAHVEARQETYEVNRLSYGMPVPDQEVQVINFERDFTQMLDACYTDRDRLLISSFYDLGLRIGGSVGLMHGDLDVRRRTVTVTRREDNPNGALSKRKGSFVVHAGQSRFFDLYRAYLLDEVVAAGIQNDYVFVNLAAWRGRRHESEERLPAVPGHRNARRRRPGQPAHAPAHPRHGAREGRLDECRDRRPFGPAQRSQRGGLHPPRQRGHRGTHARDPAQGLARAPHVY